MTVALHIEEKICIHCGKCVKVCPLKIFTQENSKSPVGLQNVDTCNACGHCVAACPTGAVVHGDFPPSKVHAIDYSLLPSPEQVMFLCQVRRSNRAMLRKPVPDETLLRIIEAAHLAPTASNGQRVQFTLVTDPEKIKAVIGITVDIFTAMASKLDNPVLRPLLKLIMPDAYRYLPVFRRMKMMHDAGEDLILRGATSLLLIHGPAGGEKPFDAADCNLAYQNGSLMAESLGVSQIYTGFLMTAFGQDKKKRLAKLLGIPGKVHAGMALGQPAFRFPNYIDRKETELKMI